MVEILERIRAYLKKKLDKEYVYDKEIGEYINMSPESMSRIKKNNTVPYQKIVEFCEREKVSADWILFGKNYDEKERIKIRYRHDVRASAGGGAQNYDDNYLEIEIDEHLSKALGLSKSDEKYIEAINVIGDSMSPVIEDGAIAYIDTRKRDISNSGIYAVSTNNSGLFIKRVVLDPIANKIELISENKYYDKITLDPDEVVIVGRVIGVTSKVF